MLYQTNGIRITQQTQHRRKNLLGKSIQKVKESTKEGKVKEWWQETQPCREEQEEAFLQEEAQPPNQVILLSCSIPKK